MRLSYQTNRRTSQRAFTLAEVALALVVFVMMTIMFAATFPIANRSAHYSNEYAQAALLAQHKLDQLHSAGFTNLNYAYLTGAGIVDTNSTASGPPYTFTGVDNLGSFFPNGTTGVIAITDYSTLANVTTKPPAGTVSVVTVTLTWPGAGTKSGSYSTSAIMVHQ